MEKLAYIHNIQVEYGLCNGTWEYEYSSAANYIEKHSMLDAGESLAFDFSLVPVSPTTE